MKLSKITLACLVATGVTAPQFAVADDSFSMHGYARFGTQYEQDGNTNIAANGQTGNAAGRLGNEGNGGEWLFSKAFEGENGTQWDVGMMLEEWGGGVALKQAYAGASNVFESQPNAYIWAGRVFHSRMQQGLNDYYLSIQDGQGAGIKGVDLGFANLELGFVDANDGHNFALTSKLSDIKLGDEVKLDIIANYGFRDDSVDRDGASAVAEAQAAWDQAELDNTFAHQDAVTAGATRPADYTPAEDDAYLVVTKLSGWGQNLYYRYADNVENSLSWGRMSGQSSHYLSVDGSFALAERTNLEYLASFHDIDAAADADDRTTYNAIVRPTHAWNDIHSTWLEAGYSVVDFDDDQENNEAWKVTLSQNIAIGAQAWARPMLRFYVTAGEEKNAGVTETPVIVGAMWEAWW